MRLSVCITHYNRPEKLEATLESLAAQTRPPDEVLLWDDHSPRDPSDVASSFAGRFKAFRYHRNESNLGMPGNLNAVIKHATGDLIANLHDADEFDPSLLEKWEKMLLKHPDAGLVFCGLDGAKKSGGTGRVWIHDVDEYTPGKNFFRQHYLGRASSKIWGTVMVRRAVYERLLPFDAQFSNWADVDMWMRVCGHFGVAYVAEPLIILDHTATPLRAFSWEKFLVCHRMPLVNIYRIAEGRMELTAWMEMQYTNAVRCYLRHLAARLVRGEIPSFLKGLGLAPTVFWRLKLKDAILEIDRGGDLRIRSIA